MTKTVFENEEKVEVKMEVTNQPRVNQIVRKLGPASVGEVSDIEVVNALLSAHINEGWKLSFVERIASETDGHTILYVLTKD